ncbi:MAG: peptidyl-prolyl cis-trans isomerase, partial [Pseudomonadota bacterium]
MAGKPAEPTPNDLQEHYDQNPAAYTAPEYRQFDMLLVRGEDFRDEVSVPEEELRRLYDFNLERRYQTPERRTLYQFSFDTEEDAASVAADLRANGTLESAAEISGTSVESARLENALGGEILDPTVREAAFSPELQAGMISDPISGAFGWTVIQVESVIEGSTTPFEEARAEIEEQYLSNEMRRAVANAIDIVEEERDRGLDLQNAGAAAGLETITVGPIDRFSFDPGGAIIDGVPGEALQEAFLLDEGEESQPVQLASNDGYLFVSVREITPAALKPFETVEDEIVESWRRQERADRVSQTVSDLRASITEGASFDDAASPFNVTPTRTTIDRRFSEQAISVSLVEQIFTAAPGALVSAPAGDSSDQILAQIQSVSYGAVANQSDQAAFSDVIGAQLDQELLDLLVRSIVDAYPTKTNDGQLEAVFGGEL